MTDGTSAEVIAMRLDRLEERCRDLARERLMWKRFGIGAGLVGCILLLIGAAQDKAPKEVAAEAFRLVDTDGKTLAVLGQWGQERAVRLRFMGVQGGAALDVGTQVAEAQIKFYGSDRRPAMMLRGSHVLGGSLSIYDRDHKALFESPHDAAR